MAEDFADVAAHKAADSARRSAMLALICVAVALAVLLIDNQIKRHIVTKAGEARQTLDRFEQYAWQVMNGGQPQAEPGGTAAPGGGGAGDDVDDAAAAGPAVDSPGPVVAPVTAKGAGKRAGGAGGPRGDG